MTSTDGIADRIRAIILEHGRLAIEAARLGSETDLYEAGMTSFASVNVMLALETEFEIEFPDSMLSRNVFDSIASIQAAIGELSRD